MHNIRHDVAIKEVLFVYMARNTYYNMVLIGRTHKYIQHTTPIYSGNHTLPEIAKIPWSLPSIPFVFSFWLQNSVSTLAQRDAAFIAHSLLSILRSELMISFVWRNIYIQWTCIGPSTPCSVFLFAHIRPFSLCEPFIKWRYGYHWNMWSWSPNLKSLKKGQWKQINKQNEQKHTAKRERCGVPLKEIILHFDFSSLLRYCFFPCTGHCCFRVVVLILISYECALDTPKTPLLPTHNYIIDLLAWFIFCFFFLFGCICFVLCFQVMETGTQNEKYHQ